MSDLALSYHEPDIILILAQSSFLILLNVVGSMIDHYFYCGLVAQVLLGMAWESLERTCSRMTFNKLSHSLDT